LIRVCREVGRQLPFGCEEQFVLDPESIDELDEGVGTNIEIEGSVQRNDLGRARLPVVVIVVGEVEPNRVCRRDDGFALVTDVDEPMPNPLGVGQDVDELSALG
jgi:hypothetical protein